MFSIALFDSVRANLNETSDQLNSLSALPEIMHLYRYSKFSSLLTSLSRQGKFQLIILQSLSTPFPDLSLARRIRQYDRRVPIIIVTDNESLCLEGYDVPIFQFYTKAMTVQQMRMVLESLMDHAPDMGNRFFIFSSDQSMYQVRLSDITFFEANRSSLFIHTTQKATPAEIHSRTYRRGFGDFPSNGSIKLHRKHKVHQLPAVRLPDPPRWHGSACKQA